MYTFLVKLILAILSAIVPKSRQLRIEKPGKGVYLHRFYLWHSRRGDRFLHFILRDDDDPDPHDHPWDFTTFIVAGGYFDEQWEWWEKREIWSDHDRGFVATMPSQRRFLGYEVVERWTTVKRRASHTHRVMLNRDKQKRMIPAITLVKTGPYGEHRDWNFLTENGRVPWRTYLGLDKKEGDR